MYPLTCRAGYALPIKKGMLEIVGIQASPLSIAADIRLTLIDSAEFKVLPDSLLSGVTIFDHKGSETSDGTVSVQFKEGIKVRHGVAITNSENVIAGKIMVYVR